MNNLQVIEIKGQRVLTTKQLAEAYGTDEKVISKNFNNNKARYSEGKHYIRIIGMDLAEFLQSQKVRMQNQGKIRQLYLWTEKGALLHAKSINTDKAWEVYDYLVDFYFRVKEEPRQQDSVAAPQPVNKPFPAEIKPKTKAVVDVPVNDKAQKLLQQMREDIRGLETVIRLYDRYMEKENYEKVTYVINTLCIGIAEIGFKMSDLKPGMIEKVI